MSKKQFLYFVDTIPSDKLENFPPGGGQTNIYSQPEADGQNYRLDKQGNTVDGYHNLQIQANYQARSTTVRKEAPGTVAAVHVLEGSDPPVTTQEVRDAFKESRNTRKTVKLGTKPKEDDKYEASEDKKGEGSTSKDKKGKKPKK